MSSRARTKEVGQCSYRVAKQLRQGLPWELIHALFPWEKSRTPMSGTIGLGPSCYTMAEPSLLTTNTARAATAAVAATDAPISRKRPRRARSSKRAFACPPSHTFPPMGCVMRRRSRRSTQPTCACRRTRCSPARSKPGWTPVSTMASILTGQLEGCREAAHLPGRRAPGARRRLAPTGGREPVRRPERENGDRTGNQSLCGVPRPSQSVYGRPRRLH